MRERERERERESVNERLREKGVDYSEGRQF